MILYQESRQEINILITANIGSEGQVRIEGIDSGPLVKELKGDDDYEYNLTIPVSNKLQLMGYLQSNGEDVNNDQDLLVWLNENFNRNNCFSAIMAYLKKADISFDTFFWE